MFSRCPRSAGCCGSIIRSGSVRPTWPSNYLFAQIPIDHILVNGAILAVDVGTEFSHGSDHKGIWADLELDSDMSEDGTVKTE